MNERPNNVEVEQALLSALLFDNRQVPKVADTLRSEHFYNDAHAGIYRAIITLVERGEAANPLTVAPYIVDQFDGSKQKAVEHLVYLHENTFGGKAPDYARVLVDLALRRDLLAIAEDIASQARRHDLELCAVDMIEATEAALMRLDVSAPTSKPLVTVRAAVEEAIKAAEDARRSGTVLTGVTTGLTDLDWRLGGLQPGELIVLGARPSMGKSDLAWNICVNAALAAAQGKHGGAAGLMFSQEMVARQLGARYLARAAGVATDAQRRGQVSDDDFAAFIRAVPDIPLWIDSTARVTPAHVLRRARRLQQRSGLGLIVIDHLNIMGAPEGFRSQGETAVVTELTRELKGIATTLNVPVLLLSQLSRQVEMREDKRPTLSDLRQSGSIEQDADTVMFLYRDEYYLDRSEPARRPEETDQKFNDRYQNWKDRSVASRNVAEVIVAKQRMGSVGTTTLHYDGAKSAFSDLHRQSWG